MGNVDFKEKALRFFQENQALSGVPKQRFIGEIDLLSITIESRGLDINGSPKAATPLIKKQINVTMNM